MVDAGIRKAIGALTMAIRIEQSGYRFYRRAASETSEPNAKELFHGLAEDEVAHESILRTRLASLEEEETWIPVDDAEWPPERTFADGDVIFSAARLDGEVSDYTSELSALRMAYLIEKNAVAFYVKAGRETEDPIGKAMYEDLANWERGHQRMLEEEYRFLADRFKLDIGFAPF